MEKAKPTLDEGCWPSYTSCSEFIGTRGDADADSSSSCADGVERLRDTFAKLLPPTTPYVSVSLAPATVWRWVRRGAMVGVAGVAVTGLWYNRGWGVPVGRALSSVVSRLRRLILRPFQRAIGALLTTPRTIRPRIAKPN